MSVIARHTVKGLSGWEDIKIPLINCRCNSEAHAVWHRSDVMIINLNTLEVARSIYINGNIDFIELFGSCCYIVSHDYSGSTIRTFSTESPEIKVTKVNKYKVTCIEHIDPFLYVAGTDNAMLIWISSSEVTNLTKILEQKAPSVITLKSYYLENNLIIACGMDNGDVMLVGPRESIDSVPNPDQQYGKVAGIEMLRYSNKDYIVIFRESPASLSVVRHSDAECDFYEEFYAPMDESSTLLQITSFNGCSVFLLTLNFTTLKLNVYSGSSKLETLYENQFTRQDILNVVTFIIPENSLFYNKIEFGCDLWMISRGGSDIQVMSLSYSREESLIQEISDYCIDKSIFQESELQIRVLKEFSELGKFESEYDDNDFKILDLLISQNKGSLLADLLLRRIGSTFLVPNDYVAAVNKWVREELHYKNERLYEFIVPELLQWDSIEIRDLSGLEFYLEAIYQYYYVSLALETRNKDHSLVDLCDSFIFIARTLLWISDKNLLEVFRGKHWKSQRERLETLNRSYMEKFNTYESYSLTIDTWTQSLPETLLVKFATSLDKKSLIDLLLTTDKDVFTRIFLYLLLDIEEDFLELKNIHLGFSQYFLINSNETSYVKGHWCLDMLSHPKFISDDPANQSEAIRVYAKDALYELTKITDGLENNQKNNVAKCFYINGAVEQALHWILSCGMDWSCANTIENAMRIFFDEDQDVFEQKYMWIRAYGLINIAYSSTSNNEVLMKSFIDLMELTKKYKYMPSIAFVPDLKKEYLQMIPRDPKIRFFTLISNKLYKTAFESVPIPAGVDEDSIQFSYLVSSLKKHLNASFDAPIQATYVKVEPAVPSSYKTNSHKFLQINAAESQSNTISSIKPKKLFNSSLTS